MLKLTAAQAQAHRLLVAHYTRFFSDPKSEHGLQPDAITDRHQLAQLTAFFGWTAWAASASGPATNTHTRTTGHPSRESTTSRPRT